MKEKVMFYIFGYSDYMKNAIDEILSNNNVHYFGLFKGENLIERIIHRIFISRYTKFFSKLIMPVWAIRYLENIKIESNVTPIFIMYEVNPLSNKVQWISKMKKIYPKLKVAYIFTNIITDHNRWRLEQIKQNSKLYDTVITFNKSDAEKYNMVHIEGVFSQKKPSQCAFDKAEESDVYFCGLEKGRLPDIVATYEALVQKGIKCNFHVIYANKSEQKYAGKIHYHDELINNEEMLAGVIKSKCVLELMVDKTQPGSSLRMCEAVVYQKKLLTNNRFANEKPYYNERQMLIFEDPKDIDADFIMENVDKSELDDPSILSPNRMLDMIERAVFNENFKTS